MIVRHGLKAQAESCHPFRKTGQGVYLCGKVNPFIGVAVAKAKVHSLGEGLRVKVREVTGIRPETARSIPGQDEASRKGSGGPLPVLILFIRVTWE